MSEQTSDPSLHWDGQQWLRWNGTEWVPATAGDDPVAPSSDLDSDSRSSKALDRSERRALAEVEKAEKKANEEQEKMERRALEEQQKAEKQVLSQQQKAERDAAQEWKAFLASPPGRAHSAFERGDLVFQYHQDVITQEAVIVAMIGSTTTKKTRDPVDVLNAVCRQGWELVSGSFVFLEEGQQSRDKFMSSGQNVATKGRVKGYYLFKRCPENRSET